MIESASHLLLVSWICGICGRGGFHKSKCLQTNKIYMELASKYLYIYMLGKLLIGGIYPQIPRFPNSPFFKDKLVRIIPGKEHALKIAKSLFNGGLI